MIPEFKINPEFHGPTICDMLPILGTAEGDIPTNEVVDVRWTGSKPDYLGLERAPGWRKFRLHVPDVETQEKTTWQLGGALVITQADLDATKKALGVPANHVDWRTRAGALGYTRATMLICKVMSTALLAGKPTRPSTLAIARECVLDHIDPVDADVLMRLRAKPR